MLALQPNKGTWAPAEDAPTPQEAAQELPWESPAAPGDWTPVRRRFRDGHEETGGGAEVTLGGRGPDPRQRLVVATTDPATLPPLSTWYLLTNLPRSGSPHADTAPGASATLEELVHLYGLRLWVEQSYKQVKGHLGWADFQVRGDTAIQRHWQLVCCAFVFCWWAWFHAPPKQRARFGALAAAAAAECLATPPAPIDATGRGENQDRRRRRVLRTAPARRLAGYAAARAGLVDSWGAALALVAGLVHAPTAGRTPRPAGRRGPRAAIVSVSPVLTN